MKAGIRIGTMGMLAAGLLVGQMALAEEQGKGQGTGEYGSPGEGAGERKLGREQPREQHREQMKAQMEKNREARKKLMEAVGAEEDVQKALAMVREHCVKQHAERSAFHEAKLAELLKNMQANKAKADAHNAGLLAELDALKGKEDLTKKDILRALKDAHPEGMHNRDGKPGKECGEEMKRKRDGKARGEEMKQKRETPVKKTTDA